MGIDEVPTKDDRDENRLSGEACGKVLDALFPSGFAGRDVLEEIVPDGWESSPFARVFHPTPEQIHEERMALFRDLEADLDPGDTVGLPPTLEQANRDWRSWNVHVQPEEECIKLVGLCLWDIFSDNHDVTTPEGHLVHLGSFRGTGAFLADWLKGKGRGNRYDYLTFYLGTCGLSGRADYASLYRMIFKRMKKLALDWVYQFPRLGIVMKQDSEADKGLIEEYDPSQALKDEEEKAERAQEAAQLMADLEQDYQDAVKEAQESEPPDTVRAYRDVYGHFPRGWPPAM